MKQHHSMIRSGALGVAGAIAATVALVLPALAGDVLTNAQIAQQRLQQLHGALGVYENMDGQLPPDPAELYPDFVSDPQTFWHPGDADPAPETIDNSVPNAPNSAQVSFHWDMLQNAAPDHVLIPDNSADNNAGLFINMITSDRVIETDPPLATPTPTAVALAQAHMQRIGISLAIYLQDNHGQFPDDLMPLWDHGHLVSPRSFWNPGDDDPMPDDITNSNLDAPNSTQVSFEYLASGLSDGDLTPETVLLRDIDAANNAGLGSFVLTGWFTVQFLLADPCGADFNADGLVNSFDLATLLGTWGDHSDQPQDLNGDGTVDPADLTILLNHWGPCI